MAVIFSFTFSVLTSKILSYFVQFLTGELIIASEEALNPVPDVLGVSMNQNSAVIDAKVPYNITGELREFQVSVSDAEAFDTSAPDIELCRLAANGNLAAFELIYERYHRRTYSLCLRMSSSQTEAEDLTQEVFIQLFRKIGSFRGDSAFSTWLHRLTVNQVLMHFRRRSVKNERTSEDGEMPEQTVRGSANPNKMQVVDRIALKNAIAELPNGYRNVFVLHDVEGFEHEEVARMMGISVGTSKSQLHKARLKLRGLLIKQQD
jgi:RNA polymerase sigma-70 factor (ECF subfamily)